MTAIILLKLYLIYCKIILLKSRGDEILADLEENKKILHDLTNRLKSIGDSL